MVIVFQRSFREWGVPMPLWVEVDRDFPVVHVAGELDQVTAPVLAAAIQIRVDAGHFDLVLDLHKLTFLDSSGLGVLVTQHKALRQRHGRLRIANAPSRVLAVLNLTRLDHVLEVYPSVDAALAIGE